MPIDMREPKPLAKIMVRMMGDNKLEVWTTNAAIFVQAKMEATRFGSIQAGTQTATDGSAMLTVDVNPCYLFVDVALWIARGGMLIDKEGELRKVNDDASY